MSIRLNVRKIGWPLLLVVLFLVGFLIFSGCGKKDVDFSASPINVVLPDGFTIKTTTANTEETRNQGLSGRSSLAVDGGMLFVFDQPGQYPFWMANMNFPIDILWLDDEYEVVKLETNVQPEPNIPESKLKRYTNERLARYVLEIPAYTALRHQVQPESHLVLISS